MGRRGRRRESRAGRREHARVRLAGHDVAAAAQLREEVAEEGLEHGDVEVRLRVVVVAAGARRLAGGEARRRRVLEEEQRRAAGHVLPAARVVEDARRAGARGEGVVVERQRAHLRQQADERAAARAALLPLHERRVLVGVEREVVVRVDDDAGPPGVGRRHVAAVVPAGQRAAVAGQARAVDLVRGDGGRGAVERAREEQEGELHSV